MAWLGAWTYRKIFSIPSAKAASAETNLPLNAKISTSAGTNAHDLSPIFDEIGANNLKLAITTSDGTTQCYVEIDQWDEVGEVANLFFKAPSVSDSVETEFYLYYDSGEADNNTYVGVVGSAPGQTVWSAMHKGVYHMAQDPTGGAGSILDSTSNGNDGTPQGGMIAGDLVTGQMGKGLYFDATYIDLGDILDVGTATDLELVALFKTDGVAAGETHLVAKRVNAGDFEGYGLRSGPTNVRFSLDNTSGGTSVVDSNADDSAYHNLSAGCDRDVGASLLLDQGTLSTSSTTTDEDNADNALSLLIAGNNATGTFKGTIDEIRVIHGVTSEGWKKLQHYSHDDDLFTWGVHTASMSMGDISTMSGIANMVHSSTTLAMADVSGMTGLANLTLQPTLSVSDTSSMVAEGTLFYTYDRILINTNIDRQRDFVSGIKQNFNLVKYIDQQKNFILER